MSENGSGLRWYAVQTRSRFEKRVTEELAQKNLQSYCPQVEELRQWSDRKKLVSRPVFPGYVFARFQDCGATRIKVTSVPGAVRVIGFNGVLEPIPDEQVESLQRMLQCGQTFYIQPWLREGAWVRVRSGPLRDLEGHLIRFKTRARLVLGIELLSQSIATEVNMSDVEVIRPRA